MTTTRLIALDLRASSGPCRHQGHRDTCASFATAAAHERVLTGGAELSEEYAHWASDEVHPSLQEARPVSHVLEGITAHAHGHAADWPYGMPPYTAGPPANATSAAAIARRVSPGPWRELGETDIHVAARELHAGHGLILSLGVVRDAWLRARRGGWIDDTGGQTATTGHAVAAVGVLPGSNSSRDALIIRNSAGSVWGDGGYGYVTDRYLARHCWVIHVLEARP